MASSYPNTLDALATNKQDDTDSKSGADLGVSTTVGDHAQHHNDLADAVNKIEAELGVNPRGASATVRERLEVDSFKGVPCKAGTTAALPASTYANGTAGVGATLTANANGVLAAQDGVTMVAGDRLLVKNQAAAAQNGIYTVTSVGAAGAPWVLTRATDADTSAKLADSVVIIEQGSTQGDTQWAAVSTAPTIGTTAIQWRRTLPFYGHGNPRFPWDPGATQVIATTVPRVLVTTAFSLAIAATQYLIGGIVVPAGRTITNVNYVATTAGGATTVDWFALARTSDRQVQAHTANTTTVPTINVITTRALTSPWTPNEDTTIWVIWSVSIATTARQVAAGPTGLAALNLLAPPVAATNGVAPTTTVPTDGSTVITAATTGITNIPLVFLT